MQEGASVLRTTVRKPELKAFDEQQGIYIISWRKYQKTSFLPTNFSLGIANSFTTKHSNLRYLYYICSRITFVFLFKHTPDAQRFKNYEGDETNDKIEFTHFLKLSNE